MNKKNTQQASKSRQKLLTLPKALTTLLTKIIATKPITKGSIYTQKKRCGNANCKCARGELHSTRLLSFSDEGKTHLMPLTRYSIFELSRIERQVQNYQQFRHRRAEVVHYFKLLLAEINKLEQNLLIGVVPKRGEKKWQKKK